MVLMVQRLFPLYSTTTVRLKTLLHTIMIMAGNAALRL